MIRIENLNLAVGNFALKDVSLYVRPGEYFVLLGPTGSGKTLLLETLCGLARARSGRIFVEGIDVTHSEPRRRRLGYLPQDYALFPGQTVRQNIRYGLERDRLWLRVPGYLAKTLLRPARCMFEKISGRPWNSDSATLVQLMNLVGVEHLADRLPKGLSGGEQQRTALARALAIRPRVMLLDEPVSALDEQTRDGVCRQLKRIQRETGTAMVHICHNFTEMLAVADRVGIIVDGRILQVGTPQDILQRPCNTRVARFVQAGNLLPARAHADAQGLRLSWNGDLELRAAGPRVPLADRAEVTAMVRPENLRVFTSCPDSLPPGTNLLEGTVGEATDLGPMVRLHIRCGETLVLAALLDKQRYAEQRATVGRPVYVTIAPEDAHVLFV